MKQKKETCIYCGKKPKRTDDHVPPKSFFPKPRASDLITVPSCKKCNQGAGKDEEFFLATFMFSDAGISDAGKRLWSEKLHRMYEKNLGLRRKIAQALEYTNVVTPVGLFLGRRMAIKPDEKRFDKVISKIVRGLYFFEYQEVIPPVSSILCLFLKTEEHFQAAKEYVNQLKSGTRGWPGIFEYRFNRLEKKHDESMWILLFYNFATFWVITGDSRTNLTKKANKRLEQTA
ncbi:MAG: HNH endonuclease [Proteobacteria bacterium]|nr:HNH endonuclease [Pseudomonadota bacterium]